MTRSGAVFGLAVVALQLLSGCDGAETEAAYFEFRGSSFKDRFVIKLVEPEKIKHARDILSGRTDSQRHVSGTVVIQQASYNLAWSYHLDAESIEFFDFMIEVCDANMRYVEEHLDEVGGAFLPESRWCPWSSELTREIKDIE